jgi:exodeoxyribonuclease VII small subunit
MNAQGEKKEKSFEAALKRLEAIVSEMERGDLSLDAMLKKFDEGMRLAQFCSRKLEEAEKKIEILLKKEDGSFETRGFLPSDAAVPREEDFEEGSSSEEQQRSEQPAEDEEPLF